LAFKLFGPRHSTPRLDRLRALSLFVSLSPAELAIVDALMHERDYLAGEVVFDEGEDGQAIYIVVDGSVAICRQGEPDTGRIATLGAGTFFGELALLDSEPRSAQARAVDVCRLAVFFRDDFFGLMETHALIASKISMALARHIGRRLRENVHGAEVRQHL
jgi:CRP-like cAMP-binding protein